MQEFVINEHQIESLADFQKYVSLNKAFTLFDLLKTLCTSTQISIETVSEILAEHHLADIWSEIQKLPDESSNLDQLRLGQTITLLPKRGSEVIEFEHMWDFYGFADNEPHERYALDFTPTNNIRHVPIVVSDRVAIYQHDTKTPLKATWAPYITLMELAYRVVYELTFFGHPDQRNEKLEELKNTVEQFKKDKASSTPLSFKSSEDLMNFLKTKKDGLDDREDDDWM